MNLELQARHLLTQIDRDALGRAGQMVVHGQQDHVHPWLGGATVNG
jgi:hypothetical protein